MIDLHSHVLAGVDDGVGTLAGSIAILRAAAEDGITRIAATPHVRDDYPTSPETMERGVAELNRVAREAGVPIEVLTGGELDIAYAARLDDATLARFRPCVIIVLRSASRPSTLKLSVGSPARSSRAVTMHKRRASHRRSSRSQASS